MKIIDIHCDIISKITGTDMNLYHNTCHFDLERAKQSGIFIEFFSLFAMPDEEAVRQNIMLQISKYQEEVDKFSGHIYPLLNYSQLEQNPDSMGSILHLEGAEALGISLETLSLLFGLGLRSLSLTWNYRNQMADGIFAEGAIEGISSLGRQAIKYMAESGIILDLSHIAEKGYFEAIDLYAKPVMVTHANTRAVCAHPRNLSDRQLKLLAEVDGVMGLTQVSDFVKSVDAGINDLLDHAVHVANLIGCRHIALGSDYDGTDKVILPGIEAYKQWPELLSKRGFSHNEIEGILYGNALRVIKEIIPA